MDKIWRRIQLSEFFRPIFSAQKFDGEFGCRRRLGV